MKFKMNSILIVGILVALSGCGANDPLSVLSSGNNAPPKFDAIVPQGNVFTGTVSGGYTSVNPYWIFNGGSGFAGNYLAPAPGFVTDVGSASLNGTNVTYVTILHSGNVSTKTYGIQTVLVRPNDYVVRSQIIGTYIGAGQVAFQVLLNNSPQCPYSYMTPAFTQALAGFYATLGSNLCQ